MRSSGSFSDSNLFFRSNGLNDTNTNETKVKNGSNKHKSHKHDTEEWTVPQNRKNFTQKKLTKALSAKLLPDDDKIKAPTHSPPKLKSRPSIRKMLLHSMSGRSSSTSNSNSPTQSRHTRHIKEDNVVHSVSHSDNNSQASKSKDSTVVTSKNVSKIPTYQ